MSKKGSPKKVPIGTDEDIAASDLMNTMYDDEDKAKNPVVIGLFNYKGGVGKSTNAMNIAVALAQLGRKTLMVDADSQCNLSSYFLKEYRNDEDGDGAEDGDGDADDNNNLPRAHVAGGLVLDVVKPNVVPVPAATVVDLPNLHMKLAHAFDGNLGILEQEAKGSAQRIRDNLWLVPGSPNIVEYESEMVVAGLGRKYVSTLGGFRQFVLLAAKSVEAEFVLVDFGPSAGLMNETFVMSCDYIFPPSFADRLSLSSVHGLVTSVLPRWYRNYQANVERLQQWLNNNSRAVKEQQEAFLLPAALPKILPLLMTGYRIFRQKIVAGSSAWIKSAEQLMDEMQLKQHTVPINGKMVLPFFRGLEAPLKLAHKIRKAVIEVTEADFKAAKDDIRGYDNVFEANQRYQQLATILTSLTPRD